MLLFPLQMKRELPPHPTHQMSAWGCPSFAVHVSAAASNSLSFSASSRLYTVSLILSRPTERLTSFSSSSSLYRAYKGGGFLITMICVHSANLSSFFQLTPRGLFTWCHSNNTSNSFDKYKLTLLPSCPRRASACPRRASAFKTNVWRWSRSFFC